MYKYKNKLTVKKGMKRFVARRSTDHFSFHLLVKIISTWFQTQRRFVFAPDTNTRTAQALVAISSATKFDRSPRSNTYEFALMILKSDSQHTINLRCLYYPEIRPPTCTSSIVTGKQIGRAHV